MPARKDIDTVLIIGAGPIVIGQACEFDYSGTQACKALKDEGYRIVLVNSNPATIMTDPDLAHATYIEPITPEVVARIIEKERTERPGEKLVLLPTMGGQTALNCALSLRRMGVLDKYAVEMIGAKAEAIDKAEDRDLFRAAMHKIGLATPRSEFVNTSALKKRFEDDYAKGRAEAEGRDSVKEFEAEWRKGETLRIEEHRLVAQMQALEATKITGLPAIVRPPSPSADKAAASPTRLRNSTSSFWAASTHPRPMKYWSRNQSSAGKSSRWKSSATRPTTASLSVPSKTLTRWACIPVTRLPSPLPSP